MNDQPAPNVPKVPHVPHAKRIEASAGDNSGSATPVPFVIDRSTALAIRAGLIQQKKGLEAQARGLGTLIAEIEKNWGIEKEK